MSDSTIGMNKYQQLIRWQVTHNSWGWDVIRVFLGLALAVRGIAFLMNPESLAELAPGRDISGASGLVAFSHLIGGLMLTVGLMTRIAALIQIPIMANATFFVAVEWGFASTNQSLELSMLVLFLLALTLIFGAGRLSLDYRLFGGGASEDDS